jgi:hypothetical protein
MGLVCMRLKREKPDDWAQIARKEPSMQKHIHAMQEEAKRNKMTRDEQRVCVLKSYRDELKVKMDAEIEARDGPDGIQEKQRIVEQHARMAVAQCRGNKNKNMKNAAMSALRKLLVVNNELAERNRRIALYQGRIDDPDTLIRSTGDAQDMQMHSGFHRMLNMIGMLDVDDHEEKHEEALENASRMQDVKDQQAQANKETGKLYNNDNEILERMFARLLQDENADLDEVEEEEDDYLAQPSQVRLAPPSRSTASTGTQPVGATTKKDTRKHSNADDVEAELMRTQRRDSLEHMEDASGSDDGGGSAVAVAIEIESPPTVAAVAPAPKSKIRSVPL